eukprot:2773931-Alexandrium_andersonii.AAC.1
MCIRDRSTSGPAWPSQSRLRPGRFRRSLQTAGARLSDCPGTSCVPAGHSGPPLHDQADHRPSAGCSSGVSRPQ